MKHPTCGRERASASGDSGFTLVEAVVALFVLGVIFTALAAAAIGSLRASMSARVEQQAIDFATEALEKARTADYYTLANVSADVSSDPRISACGTTYCIDPGTGTAEPLVLSAGGSVSPHVNQVSVSLSNEVPITLSTYVSEPADATADYKRITVMASWSMGSIARERSVTSLVTLTTRGLPLPVFKLTPIGGTSVSVNPDSWVPFAFELTNQGAPDRWNLTSTGSAAGLWSFYRDDGDGIYEYPGSPSECSGTCDSILTNTNPSGDAIVDTGRIDPTASIVFWAVRNVSDGSAEGVYASGITATSAAQAAAASASATVDVLVDVTEDPIVTNPGGGPQTTTPGAPENLQVTTGDGQLTAAWQAPTASGSSAITDYVISYKLSSASSWTLVADGVSTATTALLTGLANGTSYDVSVAAKNSSGIGQSATTQGTPVAGTAYVAPVLCAASSPAPAGDANNGYTLRQYALHNRSAANPTWPGIGTIAATSTTGQGLPLVAAVDGAQVPLSTNLPVYSSDVLGAEQGRVVVAGGSFTSTDTTKVVDWRSTIGGKALKGTAVLNLWIAPVSSDVATLPLQMTAQVYYRRSDGTLQAEGSTRTLDLAANTFGPTGCGGWQQAWLTFPMNQSSKLGADEFVGVRIWNSATSGDGRMARFRVAYDVVGDFPAYLTVPEKP